MAILKQLTTYCKAITNGKLIACQKHQWACLRFLREIDRRKEKGWLWDFDEAQAERYFGWMGEFKHSIGPLAGQRKVPCDYELFVYGNIYGWWNKRKPDVRRFRHMYEQLARKNAKSQDKAIQALYEISAFGEPRAEAYVAATKKEQTKWVWNEAAWLYQNSDFRDSFTCKYDNASREKVIKHTKSGSIFSRLSKDDGKKGDGSNPHFGILDEYHLHETTEFYDMLTSGMKTRKNPLLSIITTAGFDLTNPCYAVEYNYVSQILDPNIPMDDERYFAIICELDRNNTHDILTTDDGRQIEPGAIIDELGTDTAIMKSNPVTGANEVMRESIKVETDEAKHKAEKRRDVYTKTYNVWVQNKPVGYMDMTRWAACRVDTATLLKTIKEKAIGRCYVGIDMSMCEDLTSVSFVFPYVEDGCNKYAIHAHSFLPEETYHEKIRDGRVPYDVWRRAGHITVTDGAVINSKTVMRYMLDTCAENDWTPLEFCFDPAMALLITQDLIAEGMTVVTIRQGVMTLSVPTKLFRSGVYSRQIIHDNNPVLTWAVGNAETKIDEKANIILAKSTARLKIDPIAATINAFVRALVDAPESASEGGWGVMFV
jgi:phage terminase large subunit-like protein